ncbi:DsbA family protein [Paracoccus sediminis]|uniref:DsbA family protein n=1 Tax=Paracoccus sediminis TaxID=1214787 RepID=A0A238UW92_9RHOB|nr:DsbA family protein [Paracoccus sediminis]TBN52755.1 DsbA family protein [Paracoccus sediminis]SNR26124.1 Protein-disulfide isomerase [Paracoccus sediminis]
MQRRTFLIAGTGMLVLPTVALAERINPMPEELRKALERDPTAPVLGNPDGDVTLTEFFDYNCPFCRKMVGPIHRLILSDPNLRVVFREWPVFGPDSEDAARVSLASLSQGRYWQTHQAIFSIRGKVDADSARLAAAKAGLDMTRLEQDIQSERVERHITYSFLLADHMGLVGTPSFIAGDEGAFGEYSLEDLRGLVQRARESLG